MGKLGSISPCSLELVGIATGAGWKQREIRHRPAGIIKPQDLVLIKVSPQRKGRRWEPHVDRLKVPPCRAQGLLDA